MDNQSPESRESLWRGRLSEAEMAKLRDQPELELEARITASLRQMPDRPVASNFTARVMAAIELEEARAGREAQARRQGWNWRVLFPRLAVTAAVVLFAGIGLRIHEAGLHRAEMARSLSAVAGSETMPSAEALQNFDAIQRMSQSSRADTDLLVALQ